MDKVLEEFKNIGIIPVVVIKDVKDAVPLAKALCNGGLPVAEVTFRTDAAEDAIKEMVNAFPQMLVGAGTVLTTDQVDRAINAGAKFIVSPGLNPKIVKYCQEKNIPITPGTSCPSDIEQAIELGLDVVKFFPAEQSGGIAKIKAMSGPYTNMKFMPTGGINEQNLTDYLDFSKIIACGGSWMVKADLVENHEFDKIEELTRKAVNTMLGFKLKHIGINTGSKEAADSVATTFEKMFGFVKDEKEKSIFAGSEIEAMKIPFYGEKGHIAIQTNYIDRAIYHLSKRGFEVDMNTAMYNKDGKLNVVYFKEEIGSFAIHLVQK